MDSHIETRGSIVGCVRLTWSRFCLVTTSHCYTESSLLLDACLRVFGAVATCFSSKFQALLRLVACTLAAAMSQSMWDDFLSVDDEETQPAVTAVAERAESAVVAEAGPAHKRLKSSHCLQVLTHESWVATIHDAFDGLWKVGDGVRAPLRVESLCSGLGTPSIVLKVGICKHGSSVCI
eukprot:1169999-Amphidinium_carterae.5